MRKTGPNQAVLDVRAMAAERFPLVPRTKPVCRSLETRVAHVRDWAYLANRGTDQSLQRAAEAHNLAALILSDCGLPDLARDLCWQQAEIFLTAHPLDAATAKLALQPLINLGRLLIRDGDGAAAYQLLKTLFEAIKTCTDVVIDGREIRLANLVSHNGHYREVVQWMWTVLLADGTRALTRASRWAEAFRHAREHMGIGDRLFDGRQVAILACCESDDLDTAVRLLANSSTPTPWETAVAACMKVLCDRWADRPSDADVARMTDRYLALELAPKHVVFHIRLGLCVIDTAPANRRAPQVADEVVRHALHSTDAYAARDVLAHETCHAHASTEASRVLTEMVQESGLATPSGHRSAVRQESLLDSLINYAHVAAKTLAASVPRPTQHR